MSETRIENLILNNLFHDEDFSRKVIPYLKEEYFRQTHEKLIFRHVTEFINKYSKLPTDSSIAISVQNEVTMNEETYQEIVDTLKDFKEPQKVDSEWLVDQTESFCQEKALFNAAKKAVAIMEGDDKKLDKGAIPQLFEDALSVSFDPSVGHDYFEDAEKRYDVLHANEYKYPFDIDICNKVTKGGITKGTLNILAGGVYVGKTLGLCHIAKSYMVAGKNPLYITLEVSEENINNRIDCDLLNMSIDDVDAMPKDIYLKKVEKARAVTPGKLITKEYPATSIHVNNLRALLHELKLKKNFIPDVILVDYLNLMASSRIKSSDKTYITIQAIAEELRGLAQETRIPIWSATQLDAQGMESSDPGMTQIAGSKVGLIATVDLMWMLVSSDKLRELGQILIIQHKNRYKDAADQKKFYVGLDRKKFRWYNVENTGQIHEEIEDVEDDEISIKEAVSKKYGTEAYESAYKQSGLAKQFGPRGSKPSFKDFKV
jgi:replicative DNA helicase